MIIAVDLDGTLTFEDLGYKNNIYADPNHEAIKKINELYKAGHTIIIYTARRTLDMEMTLKQLRAWNILHDSLVMDKLIADLYIDDDSVKLSDLKKEDLK